DSDGSQHGRLGLSCSRSGLVHAGDRTANHAFPAFQCAPRSCVGLRRRSHIRHFSRRHPGRADLVSLRAHLAPAGLRAVRARSRGAFDSRPGLRPQAAIVGLSMKCPYCGFAQDRVVDSRESKEADSIRRRRECERCEKRFTTYERIDEIPYMVVKKDGRRERFERHKVLSGLLLACRKRPFTPDNLEPIVDEAENFLIDSPARERTTSEIGELIMNRLKTIDTVAYIRFASVYRDFTDVREFKEELERLLIAKDQTAKRRAPDPAHREPAHRQNAQRRPQKR